MNRSPKSTRSLSSDSSTDSIASSALKTPLDLQEEVDEGYPSTSLLRSSVRFNLHTNSNKMTANALVSRLELLPNRATTVPTATPPPSSSLASNKHKTLRPRPESTTTKLGRLRSESISSMASNTSQSSALLRATLLMASPSLRSSYHQHHHSSPHSRPQSKSHSQPHSRAHSTGQLYMRSSVNTNGKNYNNANGNNGKATPSASGSGPTPSLLTPRTSISSFASTSLSSPNSLSLRDPTGVPRPGSRGSGDRNSIWSSIYDSPRKLSVDAGSFAADATTAVSTQTSPSVAQFAPTPGAKSSLLQFGVERHERASTSRLSASTGNVVTRAQQQVDASTRRSRGTSQSHHASPSTGLVHERQDQEEDKPEPQFGLQFVTGWFGKQRDLPSISRGLEPDTTMDHSPFGGMEVTRRHHLRSATESMPSSIARKNEKRPGPGSGQLLQAVGDGVDGGALAATPRPAFPIDSHVPQQIPSASQPYLKDKEAQQTDAPRISALDKGKGRARPLSPTLTRHASSPPGDSRLRPNPSSLLSVPKPPTPPSKRSGGDLPTLAAIESGSRLMRQKIVCATCGGTGPDFPRCGRCGEAWCSRECRTEANKATGGKHRCCASVA